MCLVNYVLIYLFLFFQFVFIINAIEGFGLGWTQVHVIRVTISIGIRNAFSILRGQIWAAVVVLESVVSFLYCRTIIYVILGLIWLLPLKRFLIWMETGSWSPPPKSD